MARNILWLQHSPIRRRPLEIVGSGTNRELDEYGIQHAKRMSSGILTALEEGKITNLHHTILVSPLKRAQQTAELIASAIGLEIETIADLRAQNFGCLEGRTVTELETDDTLSKFLYGNIPPDERFAATAPSGESQNDVYNRTLRERRRILSTIPDDPLVITHGSVLNNIIGSSRKLPTSDWDGQSKEFANHIIADAQRTGALMPIDLRLL